MHALLKELIVNFDLFTLQVTFTPVTQKYFDWSELAISIFFSIAGALVSAHV